MITKEVSFKLKYLDATATRLYGLPKLHKENIILRPIAFSESPTYGLAKGLSSPLKPLIQILRKKLFRLSIIYYS